MRISTTTGEIADRLGSDELAIRAIAKAGFDACDFSMWSVPWHHGLWDETDAVFDAYFTHLREVAEACGLEIFQTHGPFPSAIGEAAEDAHRLLALRRAIRAASLLGSRYIVIHPAKHMDNLPDPGHTIAHTYNRAMFEALKPDLKAAGVQLALENMFGWNIATKRAEPCYLSDATEMLALLEALGEAQFCFCMDIGHAKLVDQSPAEMLRRLGRHVAVLHVHDNDGLHDDHTLPFLGTADWTAVCRALGDIGYHGTMNMEADAFVPKFPKGMELHVLRWIAETARKLADMVSG